MSGQDISPIGRRRSKPVTVRSFALALGLSGLMVFSPVSPAQGDDHDPPAEQPGISQSVEDNSREGQSREPDDAASGGEDSAPTEPEISDEAEADKQTPEIPQDSPDVAAQAAEITPFAASGQAEIVVNAAAIRGESTGLEGTTYTLHELQGSGSNGNPYRPGNASQFACTIEAGDTSCTITVTGISNQGGNAKRWFIVQTANPSTSYDVPQYRLNNFSNPQDVLYYVGRTVSLQSGQDYTVPGGGGWGNNAAGLQDQSGIHTRASTTAVPMHNPAIEQTCTPGLKVAIQMDVSSSIDPYRNGYRDSLNGLIDGLVGTGTEIALFTFGYASPANNREQPQLRNVDTQAAAIRGDITRYLNDRSSNATNWDAGFRRVAQANAQHDYDLVLFITDGAPNVVWANNWSGYEQPNGLNVTARSIDEAVLSANELKNGGVRIATVGVGAGVQGEVRRNLQAISGPTANGDFYVGQWDELQTYLRNIVDAANCNLPITASKTTVSNNGTTAENVSDWQFDAAPTPDSDAGVTFRGDSPQTSGSGPNGRPQWSLGFDQPEGQTAGVTLTEPTMRPGYEFVGASCTVNGAEVDAEVDAATRSVTVPGLTASSGQVHCTFTNAQTGNASWAKADGSELLAGSEWILRGPTGDASSDREVADCTSGDCDGLLDKDNRPGQFEVRGLPYGEYTLIEKVAPPGYVLDETERTVTMRNGRVDFGVIQNERLTTITIEKVVEGRTHDTDQFELMLNHGDSLLGTALTTGTETGVQSERIGPMPVAHGSELSYSEQGANGADLDDYASSTSCTVDGEPLTEGSGTSGTVTIPFTGYEITCQITNTPKPKLTLVKEVENPDAGTGYADIDDWTLTATGGGEAADAEATGLTGAPEVTSRVLPPGEYALTEAFTGDGARAEGYDWTSLSCVDTASGDPLSQDAFAVSTSGEAVTGGSLTLALQDDVTCTFTNTAKPGSVTWTKVDDSDNAVPLANSEWELTGPQGFSPMEVSESACDGTPTDGPNCEITAIGTFTVNNLPWGDYSLEETRAPAGYYPHGDPITFTIGMNGGDLELHVTLDPVKNQPVDSPDLPLTGGIGRDAFFIAGIGVLILGLAAAAGLRRRRREEVA